MYARTSTWHVHVYARLERNRRINIAGATAIKFRTTQCYFRLTARVEVLIFAYLVLGSTTVRIHIHAMVILSISETLLFQ